MELAEEIENRLTTHCNRIRIAGSLRRRKPFVNDVEILYIPKVVSHTPNGEFFPQTRDESRETIDALIASGFLSKRKKTNGTLTYGEKTKLLTHTESGTPVDLFATDQESWVNCLFSRTGGKNTNIIIAREAKIRGMAWLPFGPGFQEADGSITAVRSEEEIFEKVGLIYCPPSKRP